MTFLLLQHKAVRYKATYLEKFAILLLAPPTVFVHTIHDNPWQVPNQWQGERTCSSDKANSTLPTPTVQCCHRSMDVLFFWS